MYFEELVAAYDKARAERNVFHDLMRYRVRELLLVASLYDSFIVESDGVLTEQIYGEYYKLNLSAVPRIACAHSDGDALVHFATGRFDLVILMAGLDFVGPLALAKAMKEARPDIPVLLMVTNNSGLARVDLSAPALAAIDRVFVWNGYSKLFIGMIRHVEDLRNVEADTSTGMAKVILLIEDSVRYYSRYLPLLYQVVLRQTASLIEGERGGETWKLLRSRARPKVLLASSYEEASRLFELYEPYILTVITDIRFPRGGVLDSEAGFDFIKMAKSRIVDLPVMIQSSEAEVRERAWALDASFADKSSESLEHQLSAYLQTSLGYGAFKFRSPGGEVIGEADNLEEFLARLHDIPPESVVFHASRNHFSAWLMARGEIQFARLLRPYQVEDFGSAFALKDFILRFIDRAVRERARGSVPWFDETACRDDSCAVRLGGGSVGGKGRGVTFLRSLLDNFDFTRHLEGLELRVPRSAFIGIDEFERFLERNGLWAFAFYQGSSEEVRRRFLEAPLSDELVERLRSFVAFSRKPLAVRSSGLFEDMLMVPFSGIYSTYILPNSHSDSERRLGQLCDAVRLIYASLFSERARAYFDTAGYKLEEERMAVVIQELVGSRHGRWFYPHAAGTAQSYNYYPVAYLKPEDGLCVAALGLGSYVVEGGAAHRFCPRYPKLDIVAPERVRDNSQRVFRALDLENDGLALGLGEGPVVELDIAEAEADPRFGLVASTWDIENDRLSPGVGARGPRLIDLANIVKHEALPFPKAIDMVLDLASRAMGCPVEIEYALNLDEEGGTPALYLLQVKPLLRTDDTVEIDLEGIDESSCFILSERSMGNGRDRGITDVIWVDPGRFDRSRTPEIAAEIGELDKELRILGRRYLLVGPGRWGTRDHSLGVPVAFPQISRVRAIVEADLPGFQVESSLGSHFFHNVTSMNIGYFTVPTGGRSKVDWDWIASFPAQRRTGHCVWTVLPAPMEILMDGRTSRAVVRKSLAD